MPLDKETAILAAIPATDLTDEQKTTLTASALPFVELNTLQCPKCGSGSPKLTYRSDFDLQCLCCNTCAFSWMMACADAKV